MAKELKKVVMNSRGFQEVAREVATEAFKNIEKDFLEEFESHPITRELEAGASSSNMSGTLNGYGNLFSFIGFESNRNPISELRSVIKSMLRMSRRAKVRQGRTHFDVTIPDMKVIMSATPMPWEHGRSWVRGIERGISGFGYYMNTTSKKFSRSGAGIQIDEKLRPGSYIPTRYMSEMLRNLDRNLRRLVA